MSLKNFEVIENTPQKFVAYAPGFGVHEFSTEHLTEQEAAALFSIHCPYIREKKEKAADKKTLQ